MSIFDIIAPLLILGLAYWVIADILRHFKPKPPYRHIKIGSRTYRIRRW